MIKINNLSFSYGEKTIFKNFSLEIPGGSNCLSGPSGCGKTTLLRLIAGLETPNAGSISGAPERACFMFQEDRLIPWLTAGENVAAVISSEKQHSARFWLDAVELENEYDKLPEKLSGGQQRRICLARALAFGGDMLILDEPFKGLDKELIKRLIPLIGAQNMPTIMTTHSDEEMELMCCHVIALPQAAR